MTTHSKLNKRLSNGGGGGVPPRPPSSSSGLFFLRNASATGGGNGNGNGGGVDISLLPTPMGPAGGHLDSNAASLLHGPHGLNGGVGGGLFKGLSADYGSALSSGGGVGGVGGVGFAAGAASGIGGATPVSATDDVLKLGLGAPGT